MMKKEERQQDIIKKLRASKTAISGTALSELYHVSRQSIVQDIALLKASNHQIISTNKGYLLVEPPAKQKVFKVCHTNQEITDELYTIVEAGGFVKDVFVMHEIYGKITADLSLASREDVDAFVAGLDERNTSPLMKLTDTYHYHTVEALSDEILELIERRLREKKYLVVNE